MGVQPSFPAQALTDEQFEWSIDRTTWHLAPSREEDYQTFGEPGQYLDARAFGAVQALMEDPQTVEPVARQILLEAVALYDANPRAALVLAVAAAEIGVRDAAQALAGDRLSEQWLLSRRSAPTIDEFLTGYLPLVTHIRTNDEGSTVVPERLRLHLRDAATLRNKAVHRGQRPPSAAYVSQPVGTVNDLLYLLDWFSGHEWAATRLSSSTRSAYPPVT